MTWLYKAGITLAVVAGIFISGAVVGYRFRKPEVVTKTEVVEKVNTVVKTVVVKETQPDGTTTETTTTQTETVSSETSNSKPEPQPVPVGPSAVRPPRYSAELDWTPRLDKDAYQPTGAFLARRVSDTNLWVGAGYDWRTREARIGLRVDF